MTSTSLRRSEGARVKVLLVYPRFFPTYWGMQYSLSLVGQKALMPPLGLITIAAMCPPEWDIRLVDTNCTELADEDIAWSDIILMSAMLPQRSSLFELARRCRGSRALLVVGGPYPTACPEECRPYFDVVVMNEGEVTWPRFLADYLAGHHTAVYTSDEKPDMTTSPCPRFDLLTLGHYAIIPLQYSRGCPFMCEFCDIIVMYGRRPRTKSPTQFVAELQALYDVGYRGSVFVVDDNFIGNKKQVKSLLPQIVQWNEAHGQPFHFGTEATVDLADDPGLMRLMCQANFVWVFLGIETPSIEGLKETRKTQNVTKVSLLDRVRLIQSNGLFVHGGFIIGFDSDTEDIFDRQIEFITEAAIASAMIGPLVALPGTPLYRRLSEHGRLVEDDADHQRTPASGFTNIRTTIPEPVLLQGYAHILSSIYEPAAFLGRSLATIRRLRRPSTLRGKLAYLSMISQLGIGQEKTSKIGQIRLLVHAFRSFPKAYRRHSYRFLLNVLFSAFERFPVALFQAMLGYHYYRFTFEDVLPAIQARLASIERDVTTSTSSRTAQHDVPHGGFQESGRPLTGQPVH